MQNWPGPQVINTYQDFQLLSREERLEALTWLRGRREPTDYFDDVMLMDHAANDNMSKGAMAIITNADFVNMLYCWHFCEQDELLAKLTYSEDNIY